MSAGIAGRRTRLLAGAWMALVAAGPGVARGAPPDWAYPGCPVKPSAPVDGSPVSVPGSAVTMPAADIRRPGVPPDWFPDEHGTAPPVVMSGATPTTYACGFCHLPDGHGRPENAKLAGLPADYILRQVEALRSGERRAGVEDWLPTRAMVASVAGLGPSDLEAAAEYFAAQRPRSTLKVVEAATVPAFRVACYAHAATAGEPVALGERILELPEDEVRFERRDPHVGYVAYVPVGSLARGRQLAEEAHGPTPACSSCHGSGLHGGAGMPGPPLAGRYPAYLFRQLIGFRDGARKSPEGTAMRAVVAGLTDADLIAAAAYAASQPP